MAIEVFNRYENKYMVSGKVFSKLRNRLSDYMHPDTFNKDSVYQISNLYYDTSDSHLIRTSLRKPGYKEKLRLRAYGTPSDDTEIYIEIKKKFRGLVNKRRSAMTLKEAYAFTETGYIEELKPYMNKQVLMELEYFIEKYRPVPRLYLAYERLAFFGEDGHDLRISFDTNILSRRTDIRLESGVYGEQLLPEETWLMEVKSALNIPMWLARLLSEYKIYPVSFSKYGTEYSSMLAEHSGEYTTAYKYDPEPSNRPLLNGILTVS